MEVRYSREMNHNYMIIEAPDQTETYEYRMLEDNPMEGLLRFRARQKEQGREFYYEITSRQPLSRILERQRATAGIIRSLLVTLEKVLDQTERFLLPEEGLVLDPDYIYVKPDPFAAAFCFIPGRREDFFSELSMLLKQILERTDHQDREAVVLAYNLYQTSLKENYGICDLTRCLKGAEDSIFSGEKAGREEEGSDAWRVGKKKSGARRGVKAGDGKTGNGEEREEAKKRHGMPAGGGKMRAGREQNGEERMNAGRRTGRNGQKGRGREAGQERQREIRTGKRRFRARPRRLAPARYTGTRQDRRACFSAAWRALFSFFRCF